MPDTMASTRLIAQPNQRASTTMLGMEKLLDLELGGAPEDDPGSKETGRHPDSERGVEKQRRSELTG